MRSGGDADRLALPGPPLIATKLRSPVAIAAQLDRPRLHAQLARTLDAEVRLTLVSAPPGYGKTVAVAGWLASRHTPHAWLSTWSGVSSQANQLHDLPQITEPSLFINAGKDQEIFPLTDAIPMFQAIAAKDKTYVDFPNARHYFEPEFGAREAPDVEKVMDVVVPWVLERFGV